MSTSNEPQWEIIDDKGVIYSGEEEEMLNTFNNIVSDHNNPGTLPDEHELDQWKGDLKLIHVINVYR